MAGLLQVDAGVRLRTAKQSLTFECRNPQLPQAARTDTTSRESTAIRFTTLAGAF